MGWDNSNTIFTYNHGVILMGWKQKYQIKMNKLLRCMLWFLSTAFGVLCAFCIVCVIFGLLLLRHDAVNHALSVEQIWNLLKVAGLCFILCVVFDGVRIQAKELP